VNKEAEERDKVDDAVVSSLPVRVENINANARTWIAMTAFVCTLTVAWVNLKGDMASNQKDLLALRQSVNKIEDNLKAFDRLAIMQGEIADLKKNGSDALQLVKNELDGLRTAFKIHVAKTTRDPDPIP
jgi:hypothetical protein